MGRLGKYLFCLAFFLIVCYGALVWYVNSEVEKALNNAVADVDGLSLTYEDVWVSLGDRTLTISKPVSTLPSGELLMADEVVVIAFDERHDIPHFLKVQAKGLVVQARDAQRLGLPVTQDMRGDMLVDYRYNPVAKALNLSALSYDDLKLGRVMVSGTITQLDLDAFRMEKLIGLQLKDATLEFEDRSFMDGLFSQLGMQAAASKEQVRQQVSRELQAFVDYGNQKGKEKGAEAVRNLKQFVDNSGTVTIKVLPAEPVPYIYLLMGRDLYENIDLLNLSIETK